MKSHNYKYKVALSFATEDFQIAEAISNELDRLQIKNYLYTGENIAGIDIKKKTWQVYQEQSRYALMLISKDYVKKKWANEEREVIQTVHREEGVPYIIPLRLDDTAVEGLANNIAYWEWDGNASYVAISLHQLIYNSRKKQTNNNKSVIKNNTSVKAEKIAKIIFNQRK
ncbi:TIR domain-containing protein [Psychroserpens sp.]